jgi:uncharacterized protein (DUF362 family)
MKHTLLNRRKFIKTTATGVAATYLAPASILNTRKAIGAEPKSRVVVATRSKLIDSSDRINREVVRATVDEVLMALTNKPSTRDAWLHIFPNLHSTDVVGLKVNSINKNLPSHPEVAYSIAQSLVDSLDVNPNSILIWDRSDEELRKAGYTVNTTKKGIRCFGTVPKLGVLNWVLRTTPDSNIGYDESFEVDLGNDTKVYLSRIVTEMCDYLINVPVVKTSRSAGLTLSMKNHFGSISRPQSCHDGGGDPYIGNLNNVSHIKAKAKLFVCDALFGIYKGGPFGPPQWINHQLFAATDPVALDFTGMGIIDKKRRENNVTPLAEEVTFFRTAVKLKLGTNDPKQIEKVNI